MRYATLVGPDKKVYFCRIKEGTAEPIARAYERPGLDPLRDLLEAGRNPARVRTVRKPFPLKGARYKPAVTAPSKIIAIGLNYLNHARETGNEVPKAPMSWCKYTSSLIGSGELIKFRPEDSTKIDYECELAFVIGRRARNVARKNALKHVFGYTCCNDVTARDHQRAEGQFARSKSFDTFTPLGPVIVTADEIADPQKLMIRTRLNGEVMQEESTGDMIFGCAELIAYLSRFITLEPGDVVSTGTPSGVGVARKPPVYMKNGDTVEIEIDGIGTLKNRIRTIK